MRIGDMSKFIKVAKVSDLAPGEKILVEYEDDDVGLFNLDGQIYAISDVCTHDGGPLVEGHVDGDCIVCPRHGARFNLKTGEQTMPAFSPVPLYQVKIEKDDILIAPQE
jgi:3-phenylpropionate/trans-cinnamate dioxygenase ferredoxin subunit